MKNIKLIIFVVLILVVIASIVLVFLNNNEKNNVDIYESQDEKVDVYIKDNYFVGQINEFYMNYNMYIGKKVSYEGYILYSPAGQIGVVRDYFCCGVDSYPVGLECNQYNGDKPNENEWVKVTGTLSTATDDQGVYPVLKDAKLEVMQTRGEQTVYQ